MWLCVQALWAVSDGHGSWKHHDDFLFPSVAQLRFMCTRGGYKDEPEDASDAAGISDQFYDGTGVLSRSFYGASCYWPVRAWDAFQQLHLWDAQQNVTLKVDLEMSDPGPSGVSDGLAGVFHQRLSKAKGAKKDAAAMAVLAQLASLQRDEQAARRNEKQHLRAFFKHVKASTGVGFGGNSDDEDEDDDADSADHGSDNDGGADEKGGAGAGAGSKRKSAGAAAGAAVAKKANTN